MKLYSLRAIKDWEPWYDKTFGLIVRAESENIARSIASDCHGDEGSAVWEDINQTSCEELLSTGEPGLIIKDFRSA